MLSRIAPSNPGAYSFTLNFRASGPSRASVTAAMPRNRNISFARPAESATIAKLAQTSPLSVRACTPHASVFCFPVLTEFCACVTRTVWGKRTTSDTRLVNPDPALPAARRW